MGYSIDQLKERKKAGEKITMLTAYDEGMARIVDEVGVDIVLVGDSVGMVVLGYSSTKEVTMDEMIHHSKAVRRGVRNALLVGDLPYEALHGTQESAVSGAERFLEEAGCDAVKMEWVDGCETVVKKMTTKGMNVMGHVGLTPQTADKQGGFRIHGKQAQEALLIYEQAVFLESVGCFSLVLECVPDLLAREITQRLHIPTIGIGSGPFCDGQVVVTHDVLGLFERFQPRFVKQYAQVSQVIRKALSEYIKDVRTSHFPGVEQTVKMDGEEFEQLKQLLKETS